jgi:hypothetical protein
MLIAAFDDERQQLQGAIGALNETGEQLQRNVKSAAKGAVETALTDLHVQIDKAARALKNLQQFSRRQAALEHVTVALVTIVITLVAVWWYVPTVAQMNALRTEHAELEASIEDLNQRGARIKLNTCGLDDAVDWHRPRVTIEVPCKATPVSNPLFRGESKNGKANDRIAGISRLLSTSVDIVDGSRQSSCARFGTRHTAEILCSRFNWAG